MEKQNIVTVKQSPLVLKNRGSSLNQKIGMQGRICAVVTNIYTGKKTVTEGKNIVTDAGDLFYAQRAVIVQPDDDHFTTGAAFAFDGIMELGDDATAPTPNKTQTRSVMTDLVASSQKAMDSGFPKVNDGDSDNTGAGVDVVTFLVSYTTGEANSGVISQVWITNPTPAAGENLLMYADFTPFAKTSSDTLKFFVNHTMVGV